jgi:hypothetical protein
MLSVERPKDRSRLCLTIDTTERRTTELGGKDQGTVRLLFDNFGEATTAGELGLPLMDLPYAPHYYDQSHTRSDGDCEPGSLGHFKEARREENAVKASEDHKDWDGDERVDLANNDSSQQYQN